MPLAATEKKEVGLRLYFSLVDLLSIVLLYFLSLYESTCSTGNYRVFLFLSKQCPSNRKSDYFWFGLVWAVMCVFSDVMYMYILYFLLLCKQSVNELQVDLHRNCTRQKCRISWRDFSQVFGMLYHTLPSLAAEVWHLKHHLLSFYGFFSHAFSMLNSLISVWCSGVEFKIPGL